MLLVLCFACFSFHEWWLSALQQSRNIKIDIAVANIVLLYDKRCVDECYELLCWAPVVPTGKQDPRFCGHEHAVIVLFCGQCFERWTVGMLLSFLIVAIDFDRHLWQ